MYTQLLVEKTVMAMRGVQLAEGFHRQKEHELEMRHAAGERLAFQGGDEAFTRSHGFIWRSVYAEGAAMSTTQTRHTRCARGVQT